MHQQKSFNKPINHLKSTHLSRMSSKCTRFSEYSNSILFSGTLCFCFYCQSYGWERLRHRPFSSDVSKTVLGGGTGAPPCPSNCLKPCYEIQGQHHEPLAGMVETEPSKLHSYPRPVRSVSKLHISYATVLLTRTVENNSCVLNTLPQFTVSLNETYQSNLC